MKALRKNLLRNKFWVFWQFDFRYRLIILLYLFKKKSGLKITFKELEIYQFFSFLGTFGGNSCGIGENILIGKFPMISTSSLMIRRFPSSDLKVFHQIFHWKEYLPVVETYKKYFTETSGQSIRIIDAGSNIGLTSLFFRNHFNCTKVVCIEPDDQNYQILDHNVSTSGKHHITKMKAAIWSEPSVLEIMNDFRDKSDWAKRVQKDKEGKVKGYSINQIIAELGWDKIDILKIDIEGAEKEVFLSENSNLDFLNITRCLAIEIHDEFNCRHGIYQKLDYYGFKYFTKGELTIAYKTVN